MLTFTTLNWDTQIMRRREIHSALGQNTNHVFVLKCRATFFGFSMKEENEITCQSA